MTTAAGACRWTTLTQCWAGRSAPEVDDVDPRSAQDHGEGQRSQLVVRPARQPHRHARSTAVARGRHRDPEPPVHDGADDVFAGDVDPTGPPLGAQHLQGRHQPGVDDLLQACRRRRRRRRPARPARGSSSAAALASAVTSQSAVLGCLGSTVQGLRSLTCGVRAAPVRPAAVAGDARRSGASRPSPRRCSAAWLGRPPAGHQGAHRAQQLQPALVVEPVAADSVRTGWTRPYRRSQARRVAAGTPVRRAAWPMVCMGPSVRTNLGQGLDK